jgi:arginyl-tRNA synthetase
MNVLRLLQRKLQDALTGLASDPAVFAAMLKPAQDARFGDYQANCAMSLAKQLDKKPREVAQAIVERLPLEDMLEPPAIAGPGFINLTLRTEWLAAQVQHMASDDRLGVAPVEVPRTFVIDYSSPNVAKPMHVGHLRSTIIGDALARLLRFLGHKVITDNHLGDWGTQFGILLYGYKNLLNRQSYEKDPVRELARLYLEVRNLDKTFATLALGLSRFQDPCAFHNDPLTELARTYLQAMRRSREQADEDDEEPAVPNPITSAYREETAKLHAGDPENRRLWEQFMPACYEEIERIYRRLEVHFDHRLGESFYQSELPGVVRGLQERGIAQDSEGAVAVFFGENAPPALVQKRDGAYTYTTTDLATIKYRVEEWNPDVILYVVDFRQALHFNNLFDVARRWGFDHVELRHVSFGSVLGSDRKPIKTREGGSASLESLLNEATARAELVYLRNQVESAQRGESVSELTPEEMREVFEVIGIGAVKYADLSQNRESDYVFNWDKMLAMEGNTATYMQYAYVRNRGIFRKGEVDVTSLRQTPPPVLLQAPEERALALQLLRFHDALTAAAAEYKPSILTGYLWDLAKTYSSFFQNCPVLKAETPQLRQSRLLLCDLTARVIQRGLDLLGIRTVERM